MLTIQGHWYHPTFLKRHWKSLCFLEEISDNLLAQRPGFLVQRGWCWGTPSQTMPIPVPTLSHPGTCSSQQPVSNLCLSPSTSTVETQPAEH